MSKQGGLLDSRQTFKGTLRQLQDKVKRDPSGYKDDVMLQIRHFESQVNLFQLAPTAPNKELCELISFLSHVAPLFKEEAKRFPEALLDVLEKHKEVLNRDVRRAMVQALCLLRSRAYVEPKEVLPLYFRLFKIKDRELRKILLNHIVSDIKKINSKVKNPQVNKQLQNYMYDVVSEDDPTAGRYALWVIIDLYRRKIWSDDRIVNVISKACFSKHTKVMTMALRFLLGSYPKDMETEESDDEEEEVKKGRNFAKKTKARKTAKEKVKNRIARNERKKDAYVNTIFKPIEVLNDPQGFGEKLMSQLQKTKERFNVRMLHMGVLANLISTHRLLILNFYPYLQRYLEPHQQHVTHIMAWVAQAVHDLVPPENIHSLMMTVANHFVTDRATSDAITVGINTIREICRRQPLVMTEDLLQDIAEYKKFKRDKGVVMASRSMIQLFRELQPEMLSRKDRGRDADLDKKITTFGSGGTTATGIDGIDLLEEYYENKEAGKDNEDEWSAEDNESESETGSWISVSDDDNAAAELAGSGDDEWQSCNSEDEDEEDEDDDEEDEEGFEVMEDTEAGETTTREQRKAKEAEAQMKLGEGSLMETKFLTPRDFQILERLKEEKAAEGGSRRKRKNRDEFDEAVTTDTLEAFSIKKRRTDAEARRATTEALRESFKAKTKAQKKAGGTTNAVKEKRKLATMALRSRKITSKKYETAKQAKSRKKIGAKRNLKFKYKKGGH